MTNVTQVMIAKQKIEINERLANSQQLAGVIAEDFWNSLECAFNEQVNEDGVSHDLIDMVVTTLAMAVPGIFDEVSTKWLVRPLEQLSEQLQAEAGDAWSSDEAMNGLDFRHGFKLHSALTPTFEKIKRAKPGIFSLLGRAVKGQLSDGIELIDQMDDEMQADGERLRAAFLSARPQIIHEVTNKAKEMQDKALLSYRLALSNFETKSVA